MSSSNNETLPGTGAHEQIRVVVAGSGSAYIKQRMNVESLEARRLLAVTPLARLEQGQLLITGNHRAEQIVLSLDPSDVSLVRVSRDGAVFTDVIIPLASITAGIEIDGRKGDDRIEIDETFGPIGPVTVLGGGGRDTLIGGDASDILDGGKGADDVSGRGGDDSIFGSSGNDTLDGGAGRDLCDGGTGFDSILGQDGEDNLIGRQGADTLLGGTGSDTITGGAGKDEIDAGDGDDFIEAGPGQDILRGGIGADYFAAPTPAKEIMDLQSDDTRQPGGGESDRDSDAENDDPVTRFFKDIFDFFW